MCYWIFILVMIGSKKMNNKKTYNKMEQKRLESWSAYERRRNECGMKEKQTLNERETNLEWRRKREEDIEWKIK